MKLFFSKQDDFFSEGRLRGSLPMPPGTETGSPAWGLASWLMGTLPAKLPSPFSLAAAHEATVFTNLGCQYLPHWPELWRCSTQNMNHGGTETFKCNDNRPYMIIACPAVPMVLMEWNYSAKKNCRRKYTHARLLFKKILTSQIIVLLTRVNIPNTKWTNFWENLTLLDSSHLEVFLDFFWKFFSFWI